MTIVPVLIFLLALCLAVAWEMFWAYIKRKFIVYMEKVLWTLLYWVALTILGVTSKMIPSSPWSSNWAPYFFVAGIHVLALMFGETLSSRPPHGPAGPSSGSAGAGSATSTSCRRRDEAKAGRDTTTQGNSNE